MADKKYDAIIIGAGIIGNCIAFELAKKGWKTLSVDKLSGSGFGSTAASCAIVRAHYSTRDGVAFAYEGFKIWDKWGEYLEIEDPDGMAEFKKTGSILLKSDGHDWRKVQAHYDSVGVEYVEWSPEETMKNIPIYNMGKYWPVTRPDEDESFFDKRGELEGAIFCPGGGYMSDPRLSSHNAEVAAKAKGAEFMFKAEVAAIRREGGKVLGITLADGVEIDAPVVLNAAGPHSFVINKLAGEYENCNIKTKALRHEVAFVPSPKGFDFEKDGYHTSDGDNGIYFRPETGNSILIGSEDPKCDHQEWITDPDEFNRNTTAPQWKAQVYRCARRINELPIPDKKRGVVDLYDCSDDWIPIYDKSDLGGYYMAIGTSGNQYKNAPVVGMMMAELIHQCERSGLDHDKDPLKFTLPETGVTIDVGFYSRNREINENSSFSVNG